MSGFPEWFDQVSWKLLLEGGSPGIPYSYFVKYHGSKDGYHFYLTDLCTIWSEKAESGEIKEKLKPYENFLELTVDDLVNVLSDMLVASDKTKFSLEPSPEGLSLQCSSQIAFVKFGWTFNGRAVDGRDAARKIRDSLLIPALQLAGNLSVENAKVGGKTVTKDQFNKFTSYTSQWKTEIQMSPAVTVQPATSKAPLAEIEKPTDPPVDNSPVKIHTTEAEPTAISPPKKTASELEAERRLQVESMLKQKPAEKKKRKLI